MRDIDVVAKAMGEAQEKLHAYAKHGPRSAEATLQQMLEILDRNDVIAARERMSKGFGQLQLA
jgi:protein tyrosine phosphatase (PTP) superfamily phosphohydrolase (DUF442 family)